MKVLKSLVFTVLIIGLVSCMQQEPSRGSGNPPKAPAKDGQFGEAFDPAGAYSASEIPALFEEGQTEIKDVKVKGSIPASCTHSGCWMHLGISTDTDLEVTFLNDDFTIPLDATGKMAVVKGTAYREAVSAERLRGYAKDAGKSDEEIAAITEDGWEYTFVADGVYLK